MSELYFDALQSQKLIYQPSGLECGTIKIEAEGKEYCACSFTINHQFIQFRRAKITPTKIGQFVTFWKRLASGPTAPFDFSDAVDFLIVSVQSGQHLGQFIFPKSVLMVQNVLSKNDLNGKRGFRVYPPWDKTDNKQATQTQKWQLNYFVNIDLKNLDVERVKKLFIH